MKRLTLVILVLLAVAGAGIGGYAAGSASGGSRSSAPELAAGLGADILRTPSRTTASLEDWIPPGARTVSRVTAVRAREIVGDELEATTIGDCAVLASKDEYEAVLAFFLGKTGSTDASAKAAEAWKGGAGTSSESEGGLTRHVVRIGAPRPEQTGSSGAAPHAKSNLIVVRRNGELVTIVLQRAAGDDETFITISFDAWSRVPAPPGGLPEER